MNNFLYRILEYLEPDSSKWDQWLQPTELAEISSSKCILQFIQEIEEARVKNMKILVAGDYDCDGIMATAILVQGLRRIGVETGFYIPNRIKEGYGLSKQTVHLAYQKGYELIVTVDNGVKAFDALSYAKELNIKTIVTDHHTLDEAVLCDVLVHPDLMEPCFSNLSGAGIAYECIRALGADTEYELMLACIASIGDVMPVYGQTRALIQEGVRLLNQTKDKHLFSLANDAILNETSIAFQIVPKINAIGRLSNLANVNNAVRYLLSQDDLDIRRFQSQLNHINDLRKQMSSQMKEIALHKCMYQDDVLLVCDPSFHEGIIGLVAGALCSQFEKPVIIMAKNPEGYKASMRAPDGFNCMDFLKGFDEYRAFGGHENAAGFSLDIHSYDSFVSFIKKRGKSYAWQLSPSDTMLIEPEDITIENVLSLDALRPFGPGFSFPDFELKQIEIKSVFDFSNGKHRRFTLKNGLGCLKFNLDRSEKTRSVNDIAGFVGKPQVSYYRGSRQVSFLIDRIVYK